MHGVSRDLLGGLRVECKVQMHASVISLLCPWLFNGASACVQEIMTQPVIAADGHTYEKIALQEWLRHHQTSPKTGLELSHTRLVPNVLIRRVLARHHQQL